MIYKRMASKYNKLSYSLFVHQKYMYLLIMASLTDRHKSNIGCKLFIHLFQKSNGTCHQHYQHDIPFHA